MDLKKDDQEETISMQAGDNHEHSPMLPPSSTVMSLPNFSMETSLHNGPFMSNYSTRPNGNKQDFEDVESLYMEPGTTTAGQAKIRDRRSSDEQIVSYEEQKRKMNKRKRVVRKGGITNVTYRNISKKRRKYVSDIFTTLLDSSWLWLVMMFAASFYVTWVGFAVLYYAFCLLRGDLLEEHLPANQEANDWMPCILEIDGFAASFLFSLETQHTIGYGSRQTTTKCIEVMIVASVQSVLGTLIQAFMVGLVFAKLSRPGSRSRTVIFSQNAVITQRNRKLCLVFRIGDLRDDNFILGTQISAKILRRRITQEGELYDEMQKLKVEPDSSGESCIFFVWPLEVVHIIDEESPFFEMSAADLLKDKFEIVVVMEGTIETTSMNFQARTSYLPNEILWGHRFEPIMLYRKDHNNFQINFSGFHSTFEVETPTCSAKDLETYYRKDVQGSTLNRTTKFSTFSVGYPYGSHVPAPASTHGDPPTSNVYDFPASSYEHPSAHLGPTYIPRSVSMSGRAPELRKTTHANLPTSPLVNSSPIQTRADGESSDSSMEKGNSKTD